jgi:branched-chain amino acid transport system permease protein
MDAIHPANLNGLDKGSAYALIALGLTLIFGTLGVVNFAHGALFMIGAFCAVTLSRLLTLSHVDRRDPNRLSRQSAEGRTPYVHEWFGPRPCRRHDHRLVGAAVDPVCHSGHDADRRRMERGLIKHFYKRPHADQILVTFGLAIVLQEIIKYFYGANPIPTPAPEAFAGSFDFGALLGFDPGRSSIPTGGWSISPSPP